MTNRVLALHQLPGVQPGLALALAGFASVRAATSPDPTASSGAPIPALTLRLAGLNRGVPVAGESAELGAVVQNCGREPWPAGAARLQMWVGGRPWPATAEGTDHQMVSNWGIPLAVPHLQPGEQQWVGTWFLPRAGTWPVEARLTTPTGQPLAQLTTAVQVYTRRWRATLRNDRLQIQFFWGDRQPGFATVRIPGATPDRRRMAVLSLGQVVLCTAAGPITWQCPFDRWVADPTTDPAAPSGALRAENVRDPDGVLWDVTLRFALDPNHTLVRLEYTWTPHAARQILQLTGPDLVIGDGSTGNPESRARVPASARQTRNDQAPFQPDPHHVVELWTEPKMTVTVGPHFAAPADRGVTFALAWNPTAGTEHLPRLNPRFAGPSPVEGRPYHRLELALAVDPPSAETPRGTGVSGSLEAGTPVRLEATLTAIPEPPPADARD